MLRGKGMPSLQRSGRGDHRVLVNVAVPRQLTDEQRELLDRFEALSGEDTYRRDEGFFEKLKKRTPLTLPQARLDHRPAARGRRRRGPSCSSSSRTASRRSRATAGSRSRRTRTRPARSGSGRRSAALPPPTWRTTGRTAGAQFHKPVRVGRLWIGPPWEEPDADAIAVVIDPGRAFGTGGHPTTQLCLELLEAEERGSVLDVGCGSGVLSIAAAKLGFAPVLAFDFDPQAVEASERNAADNGVVDRRPPGRPARGRAARDRPRAREHRRRGRAGALVAAPARRA